MKMLKKTLLGLASLGLVFAMASCSAKTEKNIEADEAAAQEVTNPETAEAAEAGDVVIELKKGEIIKPADRPIIIDFSATWCGPCQRFKPIFHEVAAANADKFYFYTVDKDDSPEVCETFSVEAIPQLSVLYPDGRIYNHEPGFMDKDQFVAFLDSIK